MVTVRPSALTVAPEIPVPELFTTVPFTLPGFTGASASVPAVVVFPAVMVALSEALL